MKSYFEFLRSFLPERIYLYLTIVSRDDVLIWKFQHYVELMFDVFCFLILLAVQSSPIPLTLPPACAPPVT